MPDGIPFYGNLGQVLGCLRSCCARSGERPLRDRSAIVAALRSFSVVQDDQVGMKGIGRSGDVFQIERRLHDGQPFGHGFEGVQSLVESVGVLDVEAAIANCPQVNARQPR